MGIVYKRGYMFLCVLACAFGGARYARTKTLYWFSASSQDAVLRMGGAGGRSPPAKARRERAHAVRFLRTSATREVRST